MARKTRTEYAVSAPAREGKSLQSRAIATIQPLIPPDAEERVERTVKQFSPVLREQLRTETGLRLADEKGKTAAPIFVVDGFPDGVARLGSLTEWHYRNLAIEIQMRGYRKQEPNEAQRESSQVLAKVFAALRQEGVGKEQIAEALKMPADDINQLVFGLALTGVKGTDMPLQPGGPRAKLRLVA